MNWDGIYGHDAVKRLLDTHRASGELAGGYLFAGPEGVGKRRLALEFATALNCSAPAGERPCGRCPVCQQFGRGAHPDLHLLIPGGASDQIRIEAIRQLLGRLALRPFNAAIQIAFIDGADRLTEEAANALLKALEEPSKRALFLLTTSRLANCLPTVVSRCQILRCAPLPADVVERALVERTVDGAIASAAARLSGGSISKALELAGRWDSYAGTLERMASPGPAEWLERPLPETRDGVAELLTDMAAWLRDVAMAAAGRPEAVAHAGHAATVREQAAGLDPDRCADTAFELLALRDSLEQFVSPRLIASLAREKWLSLMQS
jgi:DNA polymerase III subunit delta'